MSSMNLSLSRLDYILSSSSHLDHRIRSFSHSSKRIYEANFSIPNLKSLKTLRINPFDQRFHLFNRRCSSGQISESISDSETPTITMKDAIDSELISSDGLFLKSTLESETLILDSDKIPTPLLPLPDPQIIGPPLILPDMEFERIDSELNNVSSVEFQNGLSINSDTTLPEKMDKNDVATIEKQSSIEITSLWEQIKMIVAFAGPALGIWLSNPLMSLIDTAIVGNGSSLELAALGPGTVVCDQISFTFMFLSVATSNLIATSMAQKKPDEAARHFSRLLFVALACGMIMIAFSHFCAKSVICAFVGPNKGVIPAACLYAQIRGLAWPAILITSVAQSASLGLQNAWDPLWVLLISSSINFFGDILLCPILKMGIAGAAWATMISQYVGCFLMLYSLHKGKMIPLSISIPSPKDLLLFLNLALPILFTMLGKTIFYTLLTYIATSMGTIPLAAHQVMIGLFAVCAVCGEPLSQTAQSFLPEFIVGKEKNLNKARSLVKTLVTLGLVSGSVIASFAFSISYFFPTLFSNDALVILEMQKLSPPLFLSLLLTPIVLSLEGTLLAGRDLKYLAKSVLLSLVFCSLSVITCKFLNLGIVANWWTIVGFQFVRMLQSLLRLSSPRSVLSEGQSALTFADFA